MVTTWGDEDGTWWAIAPDAREAAQAIRRELVDRDMIGKYSPVTVEKIGSDMYREVR